MQPTEDEQIVQDHMMLVQAAARALVAARRAVARRTGIPIRVVDRSRPRAEQAQQIRELAENNRARAQSNKQAAQQHDREALIARWAAAEAAREHAAYIAEAWSDRMREAGIDPAEVKATADKIEADASANPDSGSAEAAAGKASEQATDMVTEQLAEEFADQQLSEAAVAAAAAAMSEPGPDPEPASDPDAGKPLTERLRGLMPDHKIDNSKDAHRGLANETFDRLVQQGISPADLIEAARQGTDMRNATQLMNSLVKEPQTGGSKLVPDADGYQGQKLSELLRGIVPDTVLDSQNFGSWDVADEAFEHWHQHGMDVDGLVEVARHSVTPKGAAHALNEAGEEFLAHRTMVADRMIAAMRVGADKSGTTTPGSTSVPGGPDQRSEQISELLRVLMPDQKDHDLEQWRAAEKLAERCLEQGMSRDELIDIAQGSASGNEAHRKLSEASKRFREHPAAETNRIIAASEVNAGKGTPGPSAAPTPPPQPAPAPTVDVEVEL
ncbi:hypothetical protein ACWDO0_28365 [Nocardia rhamnosiphila]